MAKRKGNLVTNQRLNLRSLYPKGHDEGNKPNDVERPYHRYLQQQNQQSEDALANPDTLEDSPANRLWGAGVSSELAGRIIEEFTDGQGNFPILSKQENTVLRIYVVTGDIDEVCRRMRLSRSSINTYMARIRSKLLRLLKSRDF